MAQPKEWQKLTPYQQARLRTEMWLGSRDPHTQTVLEYAPSGPLAVERTWVPALFTAFREIFDNALDETACHGNGDRVSVTFDPVEMNVVVQDNGRGIPIEFDKKEKKHAATVLLTETFAGRNFNDDTRGNTRGLNGVGASIVNYTSESFQVEVERDGKSFSQRFLEGSDESIVEDPIIFPQRKRSKGTGTRIEFKVSRKVFKHLLLPESFVRARIYEAALCYPNLKLYYNGEHIKAKSVEKDLFPKHKPIQITVGGTKEFTSRFWLVPDFFEGGVEHTHSIVNAIPVFNGGVHIDTFKRFFYSGLLGALEGTSKRKKLSPNRSDIERGMLIFNITEMAGPHFDSQSKTRLINEGVGKIIQAALDDPDFFKGIIRRYPEFIDNIYERCAARTMKKDVDDARKEAKKNLRKKVENLEDASGYDRSKCILFLGEGNSAISGMVEARDANIHGGLPLRGKVLNVWGENHKAIMNNQALAKIMNAIGLMPGERANRHMLRYGKVYIATDADEDGKNIAALLVNFFHTLWPELFDPTKPFLYVFDTPLIIAVKGKQRKYWYNDDYQKFNSEQYKGWEVTRAKGLAALKKEDWRYCLANPKVFPIVDDGKLKEALSLIFDDRRADDRKDWIGL